MDQYHKHKGKNRGAKELWGGIMETQTQDHSMVGGQTRFWENNGLR
jgi:hypothetical protein